MFEMWLSSTSMRIMGMNIVLPNCQIHAAAQFTIAYEFKAFKISN